jgi:hypothetical protein
MIRLAGDDKGIDDDASDIPIGESKAELIDVRLSYDASNETTMSHRRRRRLETVLFERARHESLIDTPWRESAARAAIDRIVENTGSAFTVDEWWPIHPLDVSPERAARLKPIYYGAAGVVWTLHYLHDVGLAPRPREFAPLLERLLAEHRADSLALVNAPIVGYPLGDASILLLHAKLAPSASVVDELHAVIAANARHPSRGFGWGAPGSMLAALLMFERTRDSRFRMLYVTLAHEVMRTWEWAPSRGCHLWMQDLYGVTEARVGALHGWAGNVGCLLRGRALLPQGDRLELERRAREGLRALATRDGAFANWPLAAQHLDAPDQHTWRVQHCIGAPGVVTMLSDLPRDTETDTLLAAGGELTWQAGPVVKLPSLCHGVPGSGYTFLKLYARTGDDEWLVRARRFAMHAIVQADRFAREHGQRKFSLWTGDLGLAAFLADCIHARTTFPTFDVF